MKKLKVVLVGAGSVSFGRGTIADLMACEELKESELMISLVDIDKKALDRMYRLANLLKERYGSKAKIEATTKRKEVLPGANYVITSVAQKRSQLWEKDFYIPVSYGFRHILGENGGPGAAFHTLRSLHLMIPICKDMEKLCPKALLINFTNPESRVCLGVSKLTSVRFVGLCHGSFETLNVISRILEKPKADIDLTIGGINHFHWVLKIRNRSDQKDLYPEFHQRMKQSDWGLDSLTRCMYELFGLFAFPSASHIGEYVSFAYDLSGPVLLKWGLGEVSQKIEAKASEYGVVEGKEPLTEELAQPSEELAIPIICDIEFDHKKKELSVNVPNENLAVSNLPEDAIVEVPAQVDAKGIHSIKVGPLPEVLAAICRNQISIQNLLVEAYRQRSKKLLLQALILEPIVDSVDRAKNMMEHLLKLEANYLPELY